MKQTIELTCATCGVKFTAEADYFIPGISGRMTNRKGEELIFIDPKDEHHCKNCIDKVLNHLKKGDRTCS